MTDGVVVDASFVCPLFLRDEVSTESEALFERAASQPMAILGPGLLYLEVLSALQQAVRRRRLPADQLAARFELMLQLEIQVFDLEPTPLETARNCLILMNQTSLTVYDATYLHMAMALALPLATHDRTLRDVARSKGLLYLP